ncbi:NADH-quinone oxidoreductase subunit L [Stackebrandtia nassauensis]|uniref:Proton-translocating NADH-quinone oxidoreductase, chain L n=1 Tax=Stackebrandtia nassauensis (strain DSM 44728 / CIP 108903 / NRRL B-16338 / NBRC 102104 / LLR-40K-21) TaxID=446470 RepID=D3Q941_STANL|nr:NADH-quinone oxidoreductase subunit L [Stackebrandtia nassauensis]ADD40650.1 proton-translocating NADH-quinone oxidoreductase, chain L [Stackebrandtia nassauensis DSM 44728]
MIAATWALPLVPALLAAVGLLTPLRMRRVAAGLGLAGSGIALATAVALLVMGAKQTSANNLIDFGDVEVGLSVHIDPKVSAVAVAVTTVALLVQLYSIAYLRGDERYAPYAAQVGLFTAAMLLVVVADDLVPLLVGWEVMGACSYLLIGHDRELPEAPTAAVKAFVVTRVGDIGFLLGVVLLGVHAGTFNITEILRGVPELDGGVLLAAGLLILAGAAGKSAQFPLHTWLPDAMAGPTPISALIHAATMVAAGAYVLFRLLPIYAAQPVSTTVIAAVAAVTMVLAACAALAADDLKRVLAWSTVSQVAFMFGGIAVLAPDAALFHLLSHAAFKALLFLCAGAVIHMVASNLMSRMGGLRSGAPVTFWTMTLGFAALVGVPPLAGFWSKESILGAAFESTTPAASLVWWAGLLTVALTGAYATRAWLRTFFGRTRTPDAHIHDPEPLMRWPLIVLAVPTVGVGLLAFGGILTDLPAIHVGPLAIVLLVSALGVAASYALWRRDPAADPAAALGPARPVFERAFYCDEAQDALVVRPTLLAARLARRADERLVDGAVENSGTLTTTLARLTATAHTFGVPRHLLATLAGAVLIGLVGVAAYWGVLS